MSSGAKVTTAFVREQTPGVTPEDGKWGKLRRTSWGMKTTFGRNDSAEISDSRMQQAPSAGTVDVGGDVGTLFRFSDVDEFLASCFGSEWAGDRLTVGDANITFSLAETFRDINVNAIWRGARVGALAIGIPNDNDLTLTTTFAATDYASNAGPTPYYKEPFGRVESEAPAFDFKNFTAPKLGGESLVNVACIDSLNVKFDNHIVTQRCLGNGTGAPGAQLATQMSISGQIVLAWSPRAFALYQKQVVKEAVSFEFTVENEYGAYTFEFPEVHLTGDWPDGGARDIVQVTLDLNATTKSPVITRRDKKAPAPTPKPTN